MCVCQAGLWTITTHFSITICDKARRGAQQHQHSDYDGSEHSITSLPRYLRTCLAEVTPGRSCTMSSRWSALPAWRVYTSASAARSFA